MVYLFLQICEEFLRINGISLESTFMSQLDRQTPKLLSLFNAKGGAVGQRIKSQMMTLIQVRGKRVLCKTFYIQNVFSIMCLDVNISPCSYGKDGGVCVTAAYVNLLSQLL